MERKENRKQENKMFLKIRENETENEKLRKRILRVRRVKKKML